MKCRVVELDDSAVSVQETQTMSTQMVETRSTVGP